MFVLKQKWGRIENTAPLRPIRRQSMYKARRSTHNEEYDRKSYLKNYLKLPTKFKSYIAPKKVMQGMKKKGAIKWQIHHVHCVQLQPNGVPNN